MDDLHQAVSTLHMTFKLADRAWALSEKFMQLLEANALPGLVELKDALADSLLQTAALQTWMLFDPDKRAGSIPTVRRLLQSSAPQVPVPPLDLSAPEVRTDLKDVFKLRHEMMGHANFRTEHAQYGGIPRLQEVARPFIEAVMGSLGLSFYDKGTAQAVSELEQLITWASRGRT
jgi:hypothetical protein